MANNIGPKIGIEGEREYRQQLNQIIQQAKTLGSQMNELTSSFDKNMTAEQKNAATGKILSDQIDTQRNLVSKLADMTARAAQKYGENSTEALKWKEVLNKAKTELNRLESQAETATEQTEELGDAFEEAGGQTIQFGDVLKANILGDVIMRGLDLLIDKAKEFASGMIDAAAEVRAQASQFEQTFGSLGGIADAKIQSIADETGILDTRMRSAATGIYAFAKASGADSQEALMLMEDGLMAAADNAAYYDRSLEDATETLQSFLKGNYANDAALGVSATEATRNAAAFKKFKKEYKDLTEVQKQQTLLQMVLDAQELSGAMGQASREADGWENVQGNLNEAFRQFQAAAGQPFLAQLGPRIQKITANMQELQNKIDWDKIASGIDKAFGFLDRNGEQIVKTIGAIGAGFAAWEAINGIKTIGTSITGIISSLTSLGSIAAANPFTILAAAAAAMTFAIGLTYAELSKETEAIKSAREESEKFAGAAESLKESIKSRAKATDDAAAAELAEVQRLKDLKTELDSLVGANGEVDSTNRERVNFIMKELNEALGSEIEWTGNLTTNYNGLKRSIDKALKSKQAEVLLRAAEEKYTEAVQNRQKVEEGLREATEKRTQAEKELKEANDELYSTSMRNTAQYAEANKKVKAQEEVVRLAIQAEQDYKEAWADTTGAIGLYESASLAMMRGNTSEVIDLLTSESNEYKKTGEAAQSGADEEISAAQRKYDDAKREFNLYKEQLEKGTKGFTDTGLSELKGKMDSAAIDLLEAGKTAGGNSVQGVKIGINGAVVTVGAEVETKGYGLGVQMMNGFNRGVSSVSVTSAVQRQMGNAVTAGRTTLQIHSPSRVFAEIGRYTMEGFEEGILKEAANAERVVSAAFAAMPGMATEVTLPEVNNQSVTIPNINIYTQEGQDPTSIAREVERVLLHDLRTTEAAFA